MLKLNYKLSVHFLSDFPTFMRLNFLPHRKSDMWLHFLPHGRKSYHIDSTFPIIEGFPTTYLDFLPHTWISYHIPVFPTTYPSWPWCSCEKVGRRLAFLPTNLIARVDTVDGGGGGGGGGGIGAVPALAATREAWCADASDALMLLMRWCGLWCWCADAVDALMLQILLMN